MIVFARLVLAASWLACVAGRAAAESPDAASLKPMSPKQVLLAAKGDVERRAKSAQAQRFAYVMKVHNKTKGVAYQISFDPARHGGEQLQVDSPARESGPDSYSAANEQIRKIRDGSRNQTPDRALVILDLPDAKPAHYTFVKRENGYLIYAFDPEKTQILHGARQKLVAKFLYGQMGVAADTGQMAWMRMYSLTSFKPVPLAKIDYFDLFLTFIPAWKNGPLVLQSGDVHIAGSLLFKKMKHEENIQYGDFVQRDQGYQDEEGIIVKQ